MLPGSDHLPNVLASGAQSAAKQAKQHFGSAVAFLPQSTKCCDSTSKGDVLCEVLSEFRNGGRGLSPVTALQHFFLLKLVRDEKAYIGLRICKKKETRFKVLGLSARTPTSVGGAS